MFRVLLLCSLLLVAAEPTRKPRKPSILAPSLNELTREEENKLDDILDRFMLADTGRLRGAEAKKAITEFEKLGYDAIPALIRGVNRAAKINHSCPVLMISKKLSRLLMSTDDQILLEFARDEIGSGVTQSPHASALADLRVRCMLRKNALARMSVVPPGGPGSMSNAELLRAINNTRGPRVPGLLRELAKREGKEVLAGLTLAAASPDRAIQRLGRGLLDQQFADQSMSMLKEKLEDENVEVRRSAIRVGIEKHIDLVPAILERLTDSDPGVRAEARDALVKLSKTEDFGPKPEASVEQQREAQKKWQAWWKKRITSP